MAAYDQIAARIAPRFTTPADLPKEIFSEPEIYAEELQRIFYGAFWHPVAHRAEMPRAGDFLTTWLAEVPLLLTHGEDGQIRVFVNACAHRGTLLEQRRYGQTDEFECPYHRWIFDTQGALRACPGRREFRPDFREADYGLTPLRVAECAGLIFVSRDPAAPDLDDFLGEAASPLRDCMLDDGRLTLLGYQSVVYNANWKIYIDNDPYHAPLLHLAFRLLNWQGAAGQMITTQPHGHMCILYQIKDYQDNGYLSDPSIVEFRGTDDRARVVALRPVTGVTRHLDTVNVRFARPLDVDHTEVRYAFFGHVSDSAEYARHRIRQSSNLLGPSGLVSIEDAAVYNRVQLTARDGGYQRFVKGVGRPIAEATQNDEASNTVWWAHYRDLMGLIP